MMMFTDMKKTWESRRQSGLSLIELMISLAIGLLLVVVISNVYLAGRQSFRDQDESARLQETGRFVLDMVSRVVLEAGRADVAPDNALQRFILIPGAGLAIDGVNGAGVASDTLIIRFASASGGEVDCLGSSTGGTAAVPVVITQTLTLDNVQRELECTSSIGNITQPLASNVEDFQLTFGVDSNGAVGGWNVDRYVAPTTANAASTLTVRVCVLVTTADGMAPAAQQYIDCNGAAVIAGDRRIRRAFTKVIGLRNRLG